VTANDPDLARTIVWAIVAGVAIMGFSNYAIVRLLVTGRGMFERKDEHETRAKLSVIHPAER
jgi:hypothetical protein